MTETKCVLRCTENSHDPVILEHEADVILGRGPETKIKDSRCSRNQVKFKADCIKKIVEVTQVGRNACGINGSAMKKDSTVTAHHGDRIEILLGQYIHIIDFDPQPSDEKEKDKEDITSEPVSASSVVGPNPIGLSDSEDESPSAKKSRTDEPTDSASNDIGEISNWESVDNGKLLIYTPEGVVSSAKIAAYDLDGTIITTSSGSVFPKHASDWKIMDPEILSKLSDLHQQKYKIIIFTNQAGISTGKQNVKDFKYKIEHVVRKLGVPIQVFVATGLSFYRKPCPGMWEKALERNDNLNVDMVWSFYCGDSAGRDGSVEYNKKKDFSQVDLLFARNININFVTPEHHFLKKKLQPLKVNVFDPNKIPYDVPLCEPQWGTVIASKLEMIVLVGFPGAGKTHFYKTHLEPAGYVHINRDTLGSCAKCLSAAEHALSKRQSVVIDNTNPDIESRRKYIDLAKNFTSTVRCFIMNTSLQHAKHNNRFRQLTDPSHAVIGDIIIHGYQAKYIEPSTTEGFSEILRINFWPTFKNPDMEKIYNMFLLEK